MAGGRLLRHWHRVSLVLKKERKREEMNIHEVTNMASPNCQMLCLACEKLTQEHPLSLNHSMLWYSTNTSKP